MTRGGGAETTLRTALLQHSQAMAMARAEVMARPTRRSAEVRAREASAEREAARLRASGMALIGKGRGFGGAGVFESAKAARKFRLPLLPRDPRRLRPTKKWGSLLQAAAKFCDESDEACRPALLLPTMEFDPHVENNFIGATIADDDEGGWEVLVLGYEWRRGRPKFKYVIIERETGERSTVFKTDAKTATLTRGGGVLISSIREGFHRKRGSVFARGGGSASTLEGCDRKRDSAFYQRGRDSRVP